MDQSIRLVMFGRQGAGKGTQCERIAEHFGVVHFSTGDALRAAADADTEVGREVSEIMEHGGLVDDDLMIRLVTERLNEPDIAESGYVLDGFPRTIPQSEALLAALESGEVFGGGLDCVVHLDVPLEEVTRRMKMRGRADDTDDGIAARLALYDQETVPVLDWFASQGLLVTVDGLGAEAEVTERLVTVIDSVVNGQSSEPC